jgi:hypothetical protein
MDTSELFVDITLLTGIATVIVLFVYYVRLRISKMLRGYGRLKLEHDLARMSEQSQAAGWLLKRLDSPPPPNRKVRIVAEFIKACELGQLERVLHLMARGVNVNARRAKGGRTGLMLAVQNGHLEVVDCLLQKGADVNATGGRSGKTALIRASEAGHTEIVKALIRARAKINTPSTVSAKTALIGAVQFGNLSVVTLLLQAGADINARNKHGNTALDIAIETEQENLVVLLRAFGADFSNHKEDVRTKSDTQGIDGFYAVLDCKKTDSIEEIRAKYRSLIKQYHPDVIQAKGLPADFVEFANKKFQEIQEAYEYISRKSSTRN